MAWWFRKAGPRPGRVVVEPDLDVVLGPADGPSVPPQTETLFDADDYVSDFDQPELEFEAEGGAEVASESEPEPAPEPEPEPQPEPEAESGHEPQPESEPDEDAVEEPEHETSRSHAAGSHARRRTHGRSWWHSRTRAGAAASETAAIAATAPIEPAPVATALELPAAEPSAEGAPAAPRTGGAHRLRAAMPRWGTRALAVLLVVVLMLGGLFGLVQGINWFARWNKMRSAGAPSVATLPEQDNLLVIGVSDGVVVGFVALKAERATSKVLGIAIPDGAFVEVPGQGFERVGASYLGGPAVSEDAISNFLGVPFRRHVVIDAESYQTLLRNQDVSGLMRAVSSTDLSADERASLTTYFASVPTKDVWIVPLPVKPVAVGDQRYFEPQKKEIADLLLNWWGVQESTVQSTPRIIVYNGVGTPGLAGVAAQQLIRAGFRIVDSGNADDFEYATTEIHLFHGTQADAEAVRASLGVGRIITESAPQELTDMIVIIGADYLPPTSDASTVPTSDVPSVPTSGVPAVPTEGVQ